MKTWNEVRFSALFCLIAYYGFAYWLPSRYSKLGELQKNYAPSFADTFLSIAEKISTLSVMLGLGLVVELK